MTRPDWDEVKIILAPILELPETEQWTAAEIACAGAPELFSEVSRFLSPGGRADDFLENPTLPISGPTPTRSTPKNIGRFIIEQELGRGSTGLVFLARDPWLDRPVAIKLVQGDTSRSQVLREAKLLAKCNHPNIATLYGVEESVQGDPVLLLEYVEGTALDVYLDAVRPTLESRIDLLMQIARALRAAHHREIAHRDLKPQNILVSPGGQVKVIDFGIALSVEAGGSQAPSGTPGYMSPEQIEGRGSGVRSDLFSFGCIAYETLTNTLAFPGETSLERMSATLRNETSEDEDCARNYPREVSRDLQHLIETCLSSPPNDRPASMTNVLEALDVAQAGSVPSVELAGAPAAPRLPSHWPEVPNVRRRFVGRTDDLDAVRTRWSKSRWVTLSGPSGCGKTRLAIELVRQYAPPRLTLWLSVPSLAGPHRLIHDILMQLRRGPSGTVEDVLAALSERPTDIVFDSCERWRDACRDLILQILEKSETTRVLATSIQSLGSSDENVFVVPSLSLPPAKPQNRDELLQSDAARLFQKRAEELTPRFKIRHSDLESIASICRWVDGLPLAIELAAARTRTLSTREIARRLGNSFRLLAGGHSDTIPRQRTIRATFDWGYRWLSPAEQELLQQLSVFEGGWTLDAAEAVSESVDNDEHRTLELLSSLVDKSFVLYESTAEVDGHYRMLHVFRTFAMERLQSDGDVDVRRDHHLLYFHRLIQGCVEKLHGPEQKIALETFDKERENFLAAFHYSVETERTSLARDLALSFAELGDRRGLYTTSYRCLTELLGLWPGSQKSGDLALVHNWAGNNQVSLGQYAKARDHYDTGLQLASSPPQPNTKDRALILRRLSILDIYDGKFADAADRAGESLELSQVSKDSGGQARALGVLARVARTKGDVPAAEKFDDEALQIFRTLGDHHGVAAKLNALGGYAVAAGRAKEAKRYYEECIRLAHEFSFSQGLGATLINLGNVLSNQGEHEKASQCFEQSLEIQHQNGERRDQAIALFCLTSEHLATERPHRARKYLIACLETLSSLGARDIAIHGIEIAAELAATQRESAWVAELLGAANAIRDRLGLPRSENRSESIAEGLTSARSDLGDEEFERQIARGRALDEKTAIGRALSFARAVPFTDP